VASGVARYGGYKLLEQTAIYDAEASSLVRLVPGSKEDVFKSKDMSLLDKRRLMRFLLFAAGEFEAAPEIVGHEQTPFLEFVQTKFSLPPKAADAIGYALAFRHGPQGKRSL
jgi:RAB protein geranylgeranyltransferase component A